MALSGDHPYEKYRSIHIADRDDVQRRGSVSSAYQRRAQPRIAHCAGSLQRVVKRHIVAA